MKIKLLKFLAWVAEKIDDLIIWLEFPQSFKEMQNYKPKLSYTEWHYDIVYNAWFHGIYHPIEILATHLLHPPPIHMNDEYIRRYMQTVAYSYFGKEVDDDQVVHYFDSHYEDRRLNFGIFYYAS